MSFFIEDSFFILSLLPFLNNYEKVSLLSITKSVHQQFDIDSVWHNIMPFMKEANHVLIKKSIHFRSLMQRYSMLTLLQEVCNQEQWDVILLSLNYYPEGVGRVRLKSFVRSMVPDFLNKGNNRTDIFQSRNIRVPYDFKNINMHIFSLQCCLKGSLWRRKVTVKR